MPRAVVLPVAFALLMSIAPTPGGGQPPPTDKPVSPPGYHRVTIGKHNFTLPVGFSIVLVAESPQVERPVTAAFDEHGRLYVADSSGSNARPTDQVKEPTHRVVRLESTKKDGKFDKSVVFADKLSFLQGTMWREGSLYVATPPTIQKLTDTDGDGKADKREVWFDGKVLTGCANDVHGPYPGPGDGRIYFTKGAFAKQELTLGNGKKFTTRAAHIYSAKPDGSDLRVEMTGGMDNPVDVAFNSAGEMFFTTTFFQHPANGKRDGLVHNTYGAVYGKDHDPLNDHIRTRPELSEPMTHLGPAAPAGLHCYRSGAFGKEYLDNLFACQFNLAKVSRHILKEKGATYETVDSDFVVSDNRDFHPTDVIEDADGSLLIVDTGGWYKLCCPSSVFEKKDLLGGIYRVKREGKPQEQPEKKGALVIEAPTDETEIIVGDGWSRNDPTERDIRLKKRLQSASFLTRRRAVEDIGKNQRKQFLPDLLAALADEKNDRVLDTALTRALIDIGDVQTTAAVVGSKQISPRVKRAALAALDQMHHGNLKFEDVLPHLTYDYSGLCSTAWWVAGRHEDWGDKLVDYFRDRLRAVKSLPKNQFDDLYIRMASFARNESIQRLMAEFVSDPQAGDSVLLALDIAKLKTLPEFWDQPLETLFAMSSGPSKVRHLFRTTPISGERYLKILDGAKQIRKKRESIWGPYDELLILAMAPVGVLTPDDESFATAMKELKSNTPDPSKDVLVRAKLTADQLRQLAAALPEVSPVHRPDLLTAFARSTDEQVGFALVAALRTQKVLPTIRVDQVKPMLDKYPKAVQEVAAKLYADLEETTKEQRAKLDTVLKDTKPGDVRRGQAVFNGTKAACASCHKVHYVGGLVGPDLTKIGAIRSERDLLESVVFPSASFVRSYEPVKVEMKDGKSYNGIVKADRPDEVVLTLNATDEVRLTRKDIDEMKPGTVSIMPAGLDQQLTAQELADLVAFLKSLK